MRKPNIDKKISDQSTESIRLLTHDWPTRKIMTLNGGWNGSDDSDEDGED